MSKYEWEHGTIKIPAKEWARFRSAVIEEHNRQQQIAFEEAKDLYAQAKEAIKGLRGPRRNDALQKFFDRVEFQTVAAAFYVMEWSAGQRILRSTAPKKKDFPVLPKSKSCMIHLLDASIVLDNERKEMIWTVEENNHAVDDARRDPVAQVMFKMLDKMNWTRGSGGTFVGNDEYNQSEGDGANYVTAKYG